MVTQRTTNVNNDVSAMKPEKQNKYAKNEPSIQFNSSKSRQ